MPISTELTRLARNVGDLTADTNAIFEALRAKGVDVPADAQLSDVADMIETIEVSPSDPIPLKGTLAHQWNLDGSPNMLTDVVGGATITAKTTPAVGTYGFLNITYTRGVLLNVEIQAEDYIEGIFHFEDSIPSDHLRLINKSASTDIDDQSSFLIWRSYGSHYWASYMSAWYGNISSTFKLFDGKKVGLFIKSNGCMDVFVDNERIAVDVQNLWNSVLTNRIYYAIGVTTQNYSSKLYTECERVRIYRNCSYPNVE
jgi:hypothetical protein